MLPANRSGFFPYTPATNLLYGLREALTMLFEESLEHVFARHRRHAEATRRAVRAWGLEVLCANPEEYSSSLTAALVPEGQDADRVRKIILERFDMSLGMGLGKLQGKIFRIGHLGDFNDLTLAGTLAGWLLGWLLVSFMATLRFEIEGFVRAQGFILYRSPVHYAISGGFALASSVFAAWLPSRKAARVNPVDIVRGAA